MQIRIRKSLNPRSAPSFAFFAATLMLASLANVAWAALPDFESLIETQANAVVSIRTTRAAARPMARGAPRGDMPEFFRRFFEQMPEQRRRQPQPQGLGSGFVVSADGYIVTNAHVVQDAEAIKVGLHDQRELTAELVGSDPRTDIALLKVDAKGLPAVKLGDSDEVKVGQWVLAIGAPFGFEHTATQGIVSAVSRSLPSDSYVPFIQTDVAVNPGNSGGPLFALDGQVIGINSQIYSRTGGYMGVSFAIPVNLAMDVVQQLKTHGVVSRGWLGVSIQRLNQELADGFKLQRPRGALVAGVVNDSPAEAAGLRAGDVILRYGDRALSDSNELPPLVAATPIGKEIQLEVLRNGKKRRLDVTIAKLDEPDQPRQLAAAPSTRLGVAVNAVGKDQRSTLGHKGTGVVVTQVDPDSPAGRAGIRQGDIIVSLAYEEVRDPAALTAIVTRLPAGKSVPMLLVRGNTQLFIAIKLA